MQSEYQILTHLTQNEHTSQRKIASGTGLSVGTVNLLLKKMVRKGLVKLERVNGRTLRYVITPHGMAEKARLAYRYLVLSYQQIIKINRALERIVARQTALHGVPPRVVFFGPPDEILEILKIAAANIDLEYSVSDRPDGLYDLPVNSRMTEDKPLLVITWSAEAESKLPDSVPKVNILNEL